MKLIDFRFVERRIPIPETRKELVTDSGVRHVAQKFQTVRILQVRHRRIAGTWVNNGVDFAFCQDDKPGVFGDEHEWTEWEDVPLVKEDSDA